MRDYDFNFEKDMDVSKTKPIGKTESEEINLNFSKKLAMI